MVNVMGYIRRQKENFKAAQARKSQQENFKKAEELQKLRQQRITAEGKARLETARQSEVARIKAARSKTPNKLMAFGQGVARLINKGKEHNAKSKGKSFGGSLFGESNRGSTGIDFGGNGGLNVGGMGGSPFNVGPKAVEKKKEPSITIKINR